MACGSSQEEWTLDRMKRMKRLASALLALCMLATATPLPAFAQPVEESLPAAATQTADVSGSAPTEKPTAVPTEAAEAPVSTEETTGTPAPVRTDACAHGRSDRNAHACSYG